MSSNLTGQFIQVANVMEVHQDEQDTTASEERR